MLASHANHSAESGTSGNSPSCATFDHIGSLRPVFDQGRHARASPLFDRQRPMHLLRDASRRLPGPWLLGVWKHLLSHQRLDERFQDRDAMFDRSLSLVQQRQSELGDLILKEHHLGFQTGKLLDQVRLWRAGRRPRSARMIGLCLLGKQGLCALLSQTGCRASRKPWSRRKIRHWTFMPSGHLQEIFLHHAFDACIGRMGSQWHIGLFEPVLQGLGMNPQHASTCG
jgi:hypothetical protein